MRYIWSSSPDGGTSLRRERAALHDPGVARSLVFPIAVLWLLMQISVSMATLPVKYQLEASARRHLTSMRCRTIVDLSTWPARRPVSSRRRRVTWRSPTTRCARTWREMETMRMTRRRVAAAARPACSTARRSGRTWRPSRPAATTSAKTSTTGHHHHHQSPHQLHSSSSREISLLVRGSAPHLIHTGWVKKVSCCTVIDISTLGQSS